MNAKVSRVLTFPNSLVRSRIFSESDVRKAATPRGSMVGCSQAEKDTLKETGNFDLVSFTKKTTVATLLLLVLVKTSDEDSLAPSVRADCNSTES